MGQRGFAFLALVVVAVSAAAQETQPGLLIDPVVVTATRAPQLLSETAGAVSVVEQSDIQDARQTVGLDETLNRVPGVFVQSSANFAQDVRVQIRGFGTRAAFGTREIKVLVDGLPETLPDGQTDFDSVDLGSVQRVEVLRGPASSLYGNAAGGVIQLFTEDGPDTPYTEVRLTGGSYGLQKYQVKGGGRSGAARVFINSSYSQLDGYRDHSGMRSGVVTGKLRYTLSDDLEIVMLLTGVEAPKADDPGGLTRAEADRDARSAAPLNRRLDAGESVQQVRGGAVVHWRAPRGEVDAYAYALYRDFGNRLPVLPATGDGVVQFYRFSPGTGLRYTLDHRALGIEQRLLLGVDFQFQDDNRLRYANIDGKTGEPRLHQIEQVEGVGPYLRYAINPLPDLEISGGARYDRVHFDVDVRYPPGSGGNRSFDAVSPGGGVRYAPLSWFSLFANAGKAFQVPTTTELGNPNGPGFNEAIQPQSAWSYEIGARAEWRNWAYAEATGFWIDIDDELIRFQSASGRDAFRNAGRSRRIGTEIDWVVTPLRGLRWTSAISFLDSEFRDYVTGGRNLAGNQEPGIPQWRIFEELLYRHSSGMYAAADAQVVDRIFVDDANQALSAGYALVNLRLGYEHDLGAWQLSPFVGINNLTDESYDGLLRLNANAGRYFEPAPAFNAYAGLAVRIAL